MISMKRVRRYWRRNGRMIIWMGAAFIFACWLLLHKLPSLVGGLSLGEIQAANAPVGWHGIYQHPLDLPLQIVRSIVFFGASDHGQLLTRLPNVFFGALAILSFAWLIWQWHGRRTMILATLLFATAAWTLHASRLASFDVLYLWAAPMLLLIQLRWQQGELSAWEWYASLLILGLMLYVPGLIWLLLLSVYLQRGPLQEAWKQFNGMWQRVFSVGLIVMWLPLLLLDLTRSGQLRLWLGLPEHFAALGALGKQFVAVPAHLFIRGPQYPDLWLGRAPLLDAFTLVLAIIGIYFYASHWRSRRSRLLAAFFIIGWILVALNGPVSFSLLVPLMYLAAATGIAYLLHQWLKVFPLNPIARGLGIGIMSLAVLVSCVYNLRAYFIAWPHSPTTEATFRYHR
jgi:4-amino-4-deoxy-L-arabinose transferase-like glycosyltransferase